MKKKVYAVLKEIRECGRDYCAMVKILQTKSNVLLVKMLKELDEDYTNFKREKAIDKIIVLTIFGVLPRNERKVFHSI